MVVGSDDGFHRVAELARRIDPPYDEAGSSSQAHVIYLAHTNAEEMAQTLAALGLTGRGGAPRPAGAAPSTTSPSPAAPPAAGSPPPLQGEVRIAADKVSNAIVVFAGASDFWMVRELVAKLDVPRRQVYVEATILDLSVDRTRQVGLTFHGGGNASGATGFVGAGSSGFNSILIDAKSAAAALGAGGLLAGVLGPSFRLLGQDVPSFGVLLQALEQTQDVDVISKPHLLTMDNTKASLLVGQSIPFQTASSQTQLAGLISTYTRQDVALKLDLTPHLNDSDSIRLELEGEISDVPSGQDVTRPSGPITNKRSIKTAIVVRDGDTVVLGGLQKDGESEAVEKIPILGDLPILGRLFQHRSHQRVKQDLLIVLTPWVIRGPEDLRRIFERKERERCEFVERMTAFRDQSAFEAHVDYRRKRGLLEEINLAARRAELDAAALRSAERALRKPPPDGPLAGQTPKAEGPKANTD